jgi:hypothetical protein
MGRRGHFGIQCRGHFGTGRRTHLGIRCRSAPEPAPQDTPPRSILIDMNDGAEALPQPAPGPPTSQD